LQRAAQVAEGQTQNLYYIGLLHVQAGRPDSACAMWRNAIELEPALLPQILKAAEQYVDLADRHFIEAILPDSPSILILVASDYLNDDVYQDSRRHVLTRAQRLLKIADLPQAERYYLEGVVLGLNDQTLHAVQYLSRAVEMSPNVARYRYQLALYLRERGKLDDAREQATLCVRIAPGNSQYEKLLRELIHDNLTSNHQT
jgi:tetratricopeptide (TPR) repeat protein